ncbi:hypothetical protein N1030_15705 [Desulfovibrio mangrovi]|uniref:hypothetical protein n=1 Tax=Desulfovibrio mangrovi TaxID=2976983 RepID=UPI0022471836|nr:hypothetical protein [Desulfovibrio mangrovi]UZP67035.1 hypothetical protein N1030_15705 [Desulfovibrio mangrovi]
MYTVDHLVEHHLKQMEKLSRQQEKAARKREKQQEKLETAFARFREEVAQALPMASGDAAQRTAAPIRKTGLMHMLRAFLF